MATDVQSPDIVTQEAAITQEAERTEQQGHFAKLRKKTEALEMALQDRDQMLLKQQQMLEQMQSKFQLPERDEFDSLPDEELIDKAKFKRALEKERQKILKEAENVARQTYQKIDAENYQRKIYSAYPDYDQVVTENGAEKLREKDPEFFAVLSKIGDEYERRELAYKRIKRLVQEDAKPAVKAQDVANENRAIGSNYYAPGGQSLMSSTSGEFDVKSPAARKAAYERLKAAQKKSF
jgi:hypothetical protein